MPNEDMLITRQKEKNELILYPLIYFLSGCLGYFLPSYLLSEGESPFFYILVIPSGVYSSLLTSLLSPKIPRFVKVVISLILGSIFLGMVLLVIFFYYVCGLKADSTKSRPPATKVVLNIILLLTFKSIGMFLSEKKK